jgi:hypothetical protein
VIQALRLLARDDPQIGLHDNCIYSPVGAFFLLPQSTFSHVDRATRQPLAGLKNLKGSRDFFLRLREISDVQA